MESLRFETMPSSPILQAWAKMVAPSPSICSLNRMPALALAAIDASVALRTSSGSRRRSSPFATPEAHMAVAVLTRLHLFALEQVAGRDVQPAGNRLYQLITGDRKAIHVAAASQWIPGMRQRR